MTHSNIRTFYTAIICVVAMAFASPSDANNKYAYFGLEPDIVTNYVSTDDSRLGYVRVTVELMLDDYEMLNDVDHHSPLLRATIIEIFGQQSEGHVKSLVGREDIRRSILRRLKQIMKRETGKEVLKDVIFTKYLYEN